MFDLIDRRHLSPSRRDILRVGTFGLGGLSLAGLLRAQASAGKPYATGKSVVLLFLAGGPSQYETFDPKPEGLEGHTSINGHIPTALPGVRFSAYLPKLAKLADRLTVVRSFQTNHAEHNGAHKQILTADLTVMDGKPIREPSLGSIVARAAGASDPDTGMPRHVLVPPTTRYDDAKAGFAGSYESVEEGSQPAGLGIQFAPFRHQVPMKGGAEPGRKNRKAKGDAEADSPPSILDDLEPRVAGDRIAERLDLLDQLDRIDRRIDSDGRLERMDRFTRQAADVLRGGAVRKALDLSLEDPRTVAAYDTEHFRNWNCDDKSKFIRGGPSIGFSLGRQLLMARRLCEAGAGFVTVINANWDFHARKGIPDTPEGMGVFAPPLDHAVAAFLEDIRARGLEDKILLVITGEFGRSGLDKNLGRHHHPKLCPLVFAGGGLKHGRVVGKSDSRGREPDGDPVTIDDLHSTILNTVFNLGELRVDTSLPAVVQERAARGRPIAEMF